MAYPIHHMTTQATTATNAQIQNACHRNGISVPNESALRAWGVSKATARALFIDAVDFNLDSDELAAARKARVLVTTTRQEQKTAESFAFSYVAGETMKTSYARLAAANLAYETAKRDSIAAADNLCRVLAAARKI